MVIIKRASRHIMNIRVNQMDTSHYFIKDIAGQSMQRAPRSIMSSFKIHNLHISKSFAYFQLFSGVIKRVLYLKYY